MSTDSNLKKRLRNLGYKLTKQREAILDAFEYGDKKLMTARELFEGVVKRNAGTNFSTVYRNLEILVQEDIVMQVELGLDASYYELNRKDHHHHLVCKSCGKIKRTDYCPFKDMPADGDFVPTEHRFEIYGFCRDCLKKEKLLKEKMAKEKTGKEEIHYEI